MSTINKLKLWLLTMMMMVGANVWGQTIVVSHERISINSNEQDLTFLVLESDVDWEVVISYPEGIPNDWLSVVGNGSGSASTTPVTVKLHANKNTSTEEREATIRVTGGNESKIITVKQYGVDIQFTISTQAILVEAIGGEKNFNITSNANLTPQVTGNTDDGEEWFTLDKNSFTAQGVSAVTETYTITFTRNKKLKARTGSITILRGGEVQATVEVTQKGSTAQVTSDAETSFNANDYTAGATRTIKVTSNVPITIGTPEYTQGDAGWLTVTPSETTHTDATQSTEKPITLSVKSDNTSESKRMAMLNVFWTDENNQQRSISIIVTQQEKYNSSIPATEYIKKDGTSAYTIQGQRIRIANMTIKLPRGLYIVNNKKTIIK